MRIKVEQNSEEWHRLRRIKLSASRASCIGAAGKGFIREGKSLAKDCKGLKTYVMELLQDYYSTSERESFSNAHTERGHELEPSAAFLYSVETMNTVEKAGYETYDKYPDYVGCSPDLYVNDDGLAEIKSPADKGYFEYLVSEKIDSGHMWQMQHQMIVTGRKWNDYVVYNPNFSKEIIIKRVEPDEKLVECLEAGFKIGIEMIKEIKSKMDKILCNPAH
jgi:hypothetical protein